MYRFHLMNSRLVCIVFATSLVAGVHSLQADEPAGAADAAAAAIKELGGSVRSMAINSKDLEVEFHLGGRELTDQGLLHLAALKDVVSLNLKATRITDAGLVHLKDLKKLRRLHLEQTVVGDEGILHLKGLANLEYLNLYGTKVTDKSLEHLTGLKKLDQLYLWQTDVTDEGVAQLAKALPKLTIVRGVDLSKLPPITPAKPPEPLKWIAAGNEPPPRSQSGSNTEVIFENQSGKRVKLVWVGYNGQLKQYAELDPGATRRQNTYSGNTWLITDEKDKHLGYFIVESFSKAVIPSKN